MPPAPLGHITTRSRLSKFPLQKELREEAKGIPAIPEEAVQEVEIEASGEAMEVEPESSEPPQAPDEFYEPEHIGCVLQFHPHP
jgi:hypothetical protein